MANWTTLKAAINDVIKANGNQTITGPVLQSVLNSVVSFVGENATFAGIATPKTNPGSPDGPVFYLAYTEGTYSNFSGIKLSLNEVAFLMHSDSSWYKSIIGLATQEAIDSILTVSENTKNQLEAVKKSIQNLEDEKQDVLAQGFGIKIENNIISSTTGVQQTEGNSQTDTISQQGITKIASGIRTEIASQKSEVEKAKNQALAELEQKEQDAIQNFSSQRVTPEMLSESTKQMIEASGGGVITNLADDEDIQSVTDDNGTSVLKLKDRVYNASEFSGLATKILRKNVSGGINLLTQSMIDSPNTIYEIRYDFTINADITIPNNCCLKFNGGNIKGSYKLIGNSTRIEALPEQIFSEDITMEGSFDCISIYAEWFGAKSLYSKTNASSEYVQFKEVSIPNEVYSLPDAAPAFNKALTLSYLGGGEVEALSRIYHIQSTVNIGFRSILHTQNDTLFVVNMQGEATSKIIHNEETAAFTDVAAEDAFYTLARNEFFNTNSMAIAFNMHPVKTKFYGGGSITLYPSTHTIGIHVYSIGYWYMDMTYYTPIIDITICGEKKNISSPDPRDFIGTGAPTSEIGADNTEKIYYWDRTNKKYYSREVSGDWKLANAEANPHWNTCMRIEVTSGSGGGRIVNPHINCRMIYGARGLEVVLRDSSGSAWFNESWIEGSITEMYSNYISVFCEKGLSCDAHDWTKLLVQSSSKSMYDSCMFYAIRSGNIKLGHFWDVKWLGTKQKDNYYFGKQTTGIQHTWVDGSVKDLGTKNSWGQTAVDYSDKSIGLQTMWKNIWCNYIPTDNLSGGILGSPVNDDNLNKSALISLVSGQTPSKYLFDNDLTTYIRVVDTDNNKYGFYMNCYNAYNDTIEKQTRYGYILAIKYRFIGDDNLCSNVKCRIWGDRPTNTSFSMDVQLNKGLLHNQITRNYVTDTILVPISYNFIRDLSIAIYVESENTGLTFDLVGLELYINGLGPGFADLINPASTTPTAPNKGLIYIGKDGTPYINKGDAENIDWAFLGDKYLDFADKEVNRLLCEKYGDGKKLPEGIAQSITSFGNLFTGNTEIEEFNELNKFTGYTSINAEAFKGCTSLKSINLNNITAIGTSGFNGCSSLSSLDFSNIETVGDTIINGTAIKIVNLPKLKTLSYKTFRSSGVKRVENLGTIEKIPNGYNYQGAFSEMSSLEFIRIPQTCTAIGHYAFRFSSSKLTMVLEPITPPTLASDWEYSGRSPLAIYVPDESVDLYTAADVWKNYASKIKPISEYSE